MSMLLAIAVVGVSTKANAASGAFVCLQKSNKVCTQWGTLPAGGSGPQGPQGPAGPAGPAGPGADPILILKGAAHGAHASIAHDTRWCGIADCDNSIASAFELGTPVGPGTVSKLRVSLGEEPPHGGTRMTTTAKAT